MDGRRMLADAAQNNDDADGGDDVVDDDVSALALPVFASPLCVVLG